MSTNTEHNNIPDEAALESLANKLFREEDLLSPHALVSLTEPVSIPFAGVGASPSVVQQGNGLNYSQRNVAPASVAGSGASPDAIQHGNNINISNPQTGFPDNNLDRSQNNGGINGLLHPSLELTGYFPFDLGGTQQEDLKRILSGINIPSSETQLPGIPGDDAGYYFLGSREYALHNNLSSFPAASGPFNEPVYSTAATLPGAFDAYKVKKDFPILQEHVNGKQLVWLDNAATTQKPQSVIDRVSYFYEHENSNIHRAAHELAARATDAYEGARKKVQTFINAASPNEIVFVRGTTEAINLVAKSWGEQHLQPGDEIIITYLEHHANIVPWQQLAAKKGLKLRVVPVDDDGQVLLDEYAKLLNSRTKLVSFTQVSNALGTVTPAKVIIEMAHHAGARVLLDAAQSVSHMRADVQALNPDWLVFSGHKVFGPTGIGVLYGKEELLNATDPWQGGGNMIKDVTFEHTQYHNAPSRFEAGTGNIADAVGLGAAIDYVTRIGIDNIYQYEHFLLQYATGLLLQVPGLKLIGTAKDKTSVLSFTLQGYTNEQVGQALNHEGIAVRTGHHCAQPILRRFGLESTVRPSLAFYNTCGDIDLLVTTLKKLKAVKK